MSKILDTYAKIAGGQILLPEYCEMELNSSEFERSTGKTLQIWKGVSTGVTLTKKIEGFGKPPVFEWVNNQYPAQVFSSYAELRDHYNNLFKEAK